MNEITLDPKKHNEVLELKDWSNQIQVNSVESRDSAIEMIQQVKTRKSEIVEFFKDMKDKAREAWKGIVAKEKSYTDILDEVESLAKRKVIAYNTAVAEIARKERERLQAIEDKKARVERERLEKEAENLKSPELKQQRLEEAESVQSNQIVLPVATVPKGTSTRQNWKYRVMDFTLIPREYMIHNDAMLKSIARSTKGASTIPGIEFYPEDSLAVSKG